MGPQSLEQFGRDFEKDQEIVPNTSVIVQCEESSDNYPGKLDGFGNIDFGEIPIDPILVLEHEDFGYVKEGKKAQLKRDLFLFLKNKYPDVKSIKFIIVDPNNQEMEDVLSKHLGRRLVILTTDSSNTSDEVNISNIIPADFVSESHKNSCN